MNLITIDFETYYDKEFSLSKMTTEEYVRDERFEVIGVAVKVNGGETEWFTGSLGETDDYLKTYNWSDAMVLCQNTAFDAAILEWVFDIHPKAYADTMSMAQALHGINKSVSLKNLAVLYRIGQKGEEVLAALGKHQEDFTPQDLAQYGEYCRNDVELTYTLFQKMLPKFSRKELKLIDCTIKMFARPQFEVDIPLLKDHLADVIRKKAELFASSNCTSEVLQSNPKFAALLESFGVAPPMKVSPTTGKETYAFAKTDEAFKELLEHEDERVQLVVAARLGTKSSIEETRTQRFIGIGTRGKMPVPLKYSGAAVTHRWSGFDFNLQNLPRKSPLRKAMLAPKGHVVLAGDLSNIELRLGMWLAKQDDAVKKIAAGVDMYRDFAAQAFNLNYDEIPKDSDTRFIAKVCCLSLIYGTGGEKLKNTIRIQSGGKTTVTLEEATRLKDVYRENYAWVVDAWHSGQRVLESLIEGKTTDFLREGIIQVTPEGLLKPSGLVLAYPDLRKSRNEEGYWQYDYAQKRNVRDKVYGSKVYQRCTQSLARDIIGDMVLELDKLFGVALQVHDEIVCIVPEAEAEAAEKKMLEVMSTPQGWYSTLPLAAEAGFGASYGDAK